MTKPHPNFMVAWPEIRCKRTHHDGHKSLGVHVDLTGKVPDDLAVSFEMYVWDPAIHPVDQGPYCPAHDLVSQLIVERGIWEPAETEVALRAFHSDDFGVFVDMGAQIGWFTLLAQQCGRSVAAFECDADNEEMLHRNWSMNFDDGRWLVANRSRIGPDSPTMTLREDTRICLAKIDVEGAENHAIDILRPAIEAGKVDRILMEVSPVFDTYYGDLVFDLMTAGYDATVLSNGEKLGEEPIARYVNSWHQENVLFVRDGVQ